MTNTPVSVGCCVLRDPRRLRHDDIAEAGVGVVHRTDPQVDLRAVAELDRHVVTEPDAVRVGELRGDRHAVADIGQRRPRHVEVDHPAELRRVGRRHHLLAAVDRGPAMPNRVGVADLGTPRAARPTGVDARPLCSLLTITRSPWKSLRTTSPIDALIDAGREHRDHGRRHHERGGGTRGCTRIAHHVAPGDDPVARQRRGRRVEQRAPGRATRVRGARGSTSVSTAPGPTSANEAPVHRAHQRDPTRPARGTRRGAHPRGRVHLFGAFAHRRQRPHARRTDRGHEARGDRDRHADESGEPRAARAPPRDPTRATRTRRRS